MNKSIVEFDVKTSLLTANQKEVLELLKDSAKLIAGIYDQQTSVSGPGANFYPKGVSKEAIEKAAQNDQEILSPYTMVEKKGAKLVAIPYHIKFKKLLEPISEKLLEAAKITENKEFGERLEFQAKALLDGHYDEAQSYWMTMKPYTIDIVIGPIERYDDKLFFAKTSFQAWVGIIDEKETKKLQEYKEIILSARRKVLIASTKVDYYDKVQVRVDDALIFSGLIAKALFVGVNLPNDPMLMERYGSEITIFKQSNQIRFDKILKVFRKIFSKGIQDTFSEEDLKEGSLYSTALHELAHTYLRYRDSEARLKDLFPIIDELGATAFGIKVCGSLLLKDIATTKQLESIMLAYMCRSFSNVLDELDNTTKSHYTAGGAIYINYLLESGAIKETGGISWPNFMKMFVSLDELASILERLLSQGTRGDAEAFIERYGDLKGLQRFK